MASRWGAGSESAPAGWTWGRRPAWATRWSGSAEGASGVAGGSGGIVLHAVAAPRVTATATATSARTPRRYGTVAHAVRRVGIGSETMTDQPRWLPLEGAANARDLGGLPTDGGAETAPAPAAPLRQPAGPDPGRRAVLVDEVGLRTVVDLRTDVEVELEGPGPLTREPRVEIRHLSLFPESGGRTDVDADATLPWQADGEDARRGSALPETPPGRAPPEPGSRAVAFYLAYLRDRPDNVVAALRAIADSDGAAVVHCAAGKDRTGVVVALALSVAGVPRERIVADYVATARADGAAAGPAQGQRHLPRGPGQPAGRLAPAAAGDHAAVPGPPRRAARRSARLAGHGRVRL